MRALKANYFDKTEMSRGRRTFEKARRWLVESKKFQH